jgi:hypothetical protein
MKSNYFLFLLFFCVIGLQAQVSNDSILKDFNNFLKIPESNIYLHLNKSILLPGEDLGFAAYVYDHKNQKPSEIVKNLYCQILNEDKKVVKEQLLLLEKGKANGKFVIDSLIPAGNYTVRGFTNWMRNFKKPHYFEAPIKILDSSGETSEKIASKVPFIQILPEGGHLVNNVLNVIGIKVDHYKKLNNNSVSLVIDGEVKDEIQLDINGMGRFVMVPNYSSSYGIKLNGLDSIPLYKFPKVETLGIVPSVNQVDDKLFIELKTNEPTLASMDSKKVSVLVNGSDTLSVYDVTLNSTNQLVSLNVEDFSPGVNQITLLSPDKKVISKRLIFNYEKFKTYGVENITATRQLDSITTKLQFQKFKNAQLSVSVHTVNSITLDKSQSIAASFKLNPYLYDQVKNPMYYFTDVDKRKKYEMDNLMLCLGWEMYDWSFIFKKEKLFKNGFESGLAVNANIKRPRNRRFMIFPETNSNTSFVDVDKSEEEFSFENYYPVGEEKLIISELDFKGNAKKTKLSLEYYPNRVPEFTSSKTVNPLNLPADYSELEIRPFIKKGEQLDTIVLSVDKNKEREEMIKNRARGMVRIFSDLDRRREVSIIQYLNRNFFLDASKVEGQIIIQNPRRTSSRSSEPVLIVLDSVAYRDANILQGFDMADVDYIEVDLDGFARFNGQGGSGIIKIETDPALNPFGNSSKKMNVYDVPLTFSAPVEFYRPSYYSYTDDFFDKLGVMDWQGNLEVVDGKVSFKMPYLGKNELLLHIQGWAEDGILIDEIRTISVDSQ